LAQIALAQGDFRTGSARLEEGVRVARAARDAWSLAMTLDALGDLERSRGAHARAGELYEQSLAVFAQIGLAEHSLQRPHLMHNLGYVALAAGQVDVAALHFANALLGYQRAGDRRGVAECLIGSGATAAADGRGEMAVRLFAAGEAALEAARIELRHSNRRD
jgi:Tfp pilus assembly protein PilF